ncbi:MAG: alpha/beta hydrolase [Xanthobacteraceae bacterium]|nr:alpha/beta hydrolase [Xanthobacteraceae bacterium]
MPVVTANGIDIAYDEFGDPKAPVILLIMGLGTQMIAWPVPFCEALAQRGFRVVRFDNRDVGLSTKFDDAAPVDVMASFSQAMAGKPVEAPYRLDDMAADAIGLMDVLGIQRAHIVGASMGGMIAQVIAAKYPARTRSLVSIMSSSGDPSLPPGTPEAVAALLAPRPDAKDREKVIEHGMKVYRVIGSPGFPTSDDELYAKIKASAERSYYPIGVGRQLVAVLASGSRVDLLKTIAAPTLVLHGADDPLVPVEAGKDTAKHVPGAALTIVPGMGHDVAPGLVPILVDAIADHCTAADRQSEPAGASA